MGLTWADVDWERARFAVRATKTADTGADGGTRHVPIFPELMPHLREAFERAEAGQVHVVGAHRLVGENLRTQMMRIIERAGLAVWPKLFQNCRATREIELCETFPEHVVAKWLGHSESVARRHYLSVTEGHYRRAAEGPADAPEKAVQKAVQSGAETGRNESQQPPPEGQEPAFADISTGISTPKGIRTPCLRAENPMS